MKTKAKRGRPLMVLNSRVVSLRVAAEVDDTYKQMQRDTKIPKAEHMREALEIHAIKYNSSLDKSEKK